MPVRGRRRLNSTCVQITSERCAVRTGLSLPSFFVGESERAGLAPGSWQLRRGDTHVGTLALDEIDMFWTDRRFEPGRGWGEIRPLFEALKVAWQHGGTERAGADQDIVAPQMVLVPGDASGPLTGMLLRIHEDHARFRG